MKEPQQTDQRERRGESCSKNGLQSKISNFEHLTDYRLIQHVKEERVDRYGGLPKFADHTSGALIREATKTSVIWRSCRDMLLEWKNLFDKLAISLLPNKHLRHLWKSGKKKVSVI